MGPDAGRKAALTRRASVASPIICRSALAIGAHRGVASLANTLGIGCAMRLAPRSDGCAQPTTSDRWHGTSRPPIARRIALNLLRKALLRASSARHFQSL